MIHFIIRSALVVTTVTIPNAFAETNYSADFKTCLSRARDNASIQDCNGEELNKQNARLNEAFKFAMGALSDDKRQNLKATQALWISFREANCNMYYSLTGGTMDLLNGSGCELSMTRDRADTLEFFADNGDEIGGE